MSNYSDWVKVEFPPKSDYRVGDVVPYMNFWGTVKQCKITDFTYVGKGKIWFSGFDVKTLAIVFYPVHRSEELNK